MKRWIHASNIVDPYNVKQYVDKMPAKEVKASTQNEAFNYNGYLIEYREDGWCIYENFSYKQLAGPFYTWVEAEDYVDQNLD